jgi:hypothetical protein
MGSLAPEFHDAGIRLERQLTMAMPIRPLVFAIGLIGVAGCGPRSPEPPRNQPRDPLFAGLKAPPLNPPATYFTAAPIDGSPDLPAGTRPALALVSAGHLVRVVGDLPARVTAREGRIEAQSSDGRRVDVLYRLPAGLAAPPDLIAPGGLAVAERSIGSGVPGRQVTVRSEGSPLLAQVSLSGPRPLTASLGGGLRLVQRPVEGERGAGDVTVDAFDGDQLVATIPLAKATQLHARAGVYQSFVETSRFQSSYILEAWVVRALK